MSFAGEGPLYYPETMELELMGKLLTEQQVEDFRAEGFVPPFSVATTALMEEMRSRLESFEQTQNLNQEISHKP